jgi:hypothetical protein
MALERGGALAGLRQPLLQVLSAETKAETRGFSRRTRTGRTA